MNIKKPTLLPLLIIPFVISTIFVLSFVFETDRPGAANINNRIFMAHILGGLIVGLIISLMLYVVGRIRNQKREIEQKKDEIGLRADSLESDKKQLEEQIRQRKQAEDRSRFYEKNLEFLYNTSIALSDFPPDQNIFHFIAEKLSELVDSSITITNEYEPQSDTMICRSVIGIGPLSSKIAYLLGRNPAGMRFPIKDEKAREEIKHGRFEKIKGSLKDLSFGIISDAVSERLASIVGLGEFYGIGLVRDGEILGTAIVLLKKGAVPDIKMVETFIGHASIALQRRKLEEKARGNEERFRLLSDQSLLGIAILEDQKVAYINEAFAQIFEIEVTLSGYMSVDELAGALHPQYRQIVLSNHYRKLSDQDNETSSFCFKLQTGSGRQKWVEQFSKRISYQGKHANMVALLDVTDSMRMQNEIKESEERLNLALEGAGAGSWDWDIAANSLHFNRQLYALLGYKPDELNTDNNLVWKSLVHPEDDPAVWDAVRKHLKRETEWLDFQVRFKKKQGSYNWFQSVGKVVSRDENGRALRMSGILLDVNEKKKLSEMLASSEKQYKSLVDNAPVGIMACDKSGRITHVNKKLLEILGSPSEEATKQLNIFEFVKLRESGISGDFVECFRTGRVISREVPYTSKWGKESCMKCLLAPIRNDNGVVERVHALIEDIIEQKKIEKQRNEIEAEQRHQQKLESVGILASGVAHEINNPINIIMNYGEIILEDASGHPEISRAAANIVRESDRIAGIVRSLLAFARQDSSILGPASADKIINDTMLLMGSTFQRDQITVTSSIDRSLPKLLCNSQQIQQVFMNLLSNARDSLNERYSGYNENKRIAISAGLAEKDGKELLRITVEDSGVGIPQKNIERIFDPFFSTKPKHLATGLGLSVSHGIMKEHGGTLWVETEIGKGARFHMDFPMNSREA